MTRERAIKILRGACLSRQFITNMMFVKDAFGDSNQQMVEYLAPMLMHYYVGNKTPLPPELARCIDRSGDYAGIRTRKDD